MPRRRTSWFLALVLLALPLATAGCLEGTGLDIFEDPPKLRWTTNLTGCTVAVATIQVETTELKQHLPIGFEPKDASATLGADRESGYANLSLEALDCDVGDVDGRDLAMPAVAFVVTPIEDPGILEGGADHYVYVLEAHANDARLLEVYETMALEYDPAKVINDLEAGGPLAAGGQATVNGGEVTYTARLGTGGSFDLGPTVRAYHKGPRGLLVYDEHIEQDTATLGPAHLEMSNGSLMHEVSGLESTSASGFVMLGFASQGAWRLVGGEAGGG